MIVTVPLLTLLFNKIASTLPDAFHSILDAYQEVGELMPQLANSHQLFASKPYYMEILAMMYDDILDFYCEAIRLFKERGRSLVLGTRRPSSANATFRLESHIQGFLAKQPVES